jgi:hypothetical protein
MSENFKYLRSTWRAVDEVHVEINDNNGPMFLKFLILVSSKIVINIFILQNAEGQDK